MSKGFTHESTYNESIEWYTPKYIFDALGIEFDLDPCSPGKEVVPWIPAKKHLTIKDNGLTAHWEGTTFVNPPYGSDTPAWMEHLSMVGNGIALVFARPDTKWFHEYIPKADAICFVKGRIGFVPADKANEYAKGIWKPKGGCGAASMLVAYGKEMADALFMSGLGFTLPISRLSEMFRGEQRFVDEKIDVQQSTGLSNENPPRDAELRESELSGEHYEVWLSVEKWLGYDEKECDIDTCKLSEYSNQCDAESEYLKVLEKIYGDPDA